MDGLLFIMEMINGFVPPPPIPLPTPLIADRFSLLSLGVKGVPLDDRVSGLGKKFFLICILLFVLLLLLRLLRLSNSFVLFMIELLILDLLFVIMELSSDCEVEILFVVEEEDELLGVELNVTDIIEEAKDFNVFEVD